MSKIKTTVRVKASKSSMHEKGEEIGLREPALEEFVYSLYEGIVIDVEVDPDTGRCEIVGVGGRLLGKL